MHVPECLFEHVTRHGLVTAHIHFDAGREEPTAKPEGRTEGIRDTKATLINMTEGERERDERGCEIR